MRADQERVKKLLVDTVTLLCKNGLFYQEELRVEGLLGVTLDGSDVFFVHISQKLIPGEESRPGDVLLPSDLTLPGTNNHDEDIEEPDVTNNKILGCHDDRDEPRPMHSLSEERMDHSRSSSPSRYHDHHQSSKSSIHSEDSNSFVDSQDLRRGMKREQEGEPPEHIKYLRRPDPSSRVPMPQDDSELVHPHASGEHMHSNLSQFDQLIAAANQASGETNAIKRRLYAGGDPSVHAPPSGAFVTGVARQIHGEVTNAQGPSSAGGSSNEWPSTTSALEMAAHLAQTQTPSQLPMEASALASTSSWPNTPISSAGQPPGIAQFGSTDMWDGLMNRRYSMYRPRHSSDKSFVCEVHGCGRTFYHSYHLYRHQRTKHGLPYVSSTRQEKEVNQEQPPLHPNHHHPPLYNLSLIYGHTYNNHDDNDSLNKCKPEIDNESCHIPCKQTISVSSHDHDNTLDLINNPCIKQEPGD